MLGEIGRQRLTARPGEGPERRRQAHFAELLFGLLPEVDSFVGQMQRQMRRHRRMQQTRVVADECRGVADRAHDFQCSAETTVKSRRAVGVSMITFSAMREAISAAPSL